MRNLLLLLALLFYPAAVFAQVSAPINIQVQDEGAAQGGARTINCTGAGITCSVAGVTATFNAAGGSGGGNFAIVTIEVTDNVVGLVYTAVATGLTWVAANSVIVCGLLADGDVSPVELVVASGA